MSDYTIDSMVTITGAEYERMRADHQKLNERNAEYIGTIDRLRRRVAETDVEIERLVGLIAEWKDTGEDAQALILRLNEERHKLRAAMATIRNEVLEEAARVLENDCHDDMTRAEEAAAIRALKEKP